MGVDCFFYGVVSILVFLDSLLQPEYDDVAEWDVQVFQSLFFWIHFYNEKISLPSWTTFLFQSLFFWIHFYNSPSIRAPH